MDNFSIVFSEFQEKIIQFIIPVLISSFVSVVTLIINTTLTIREEIMKRRKDTYENMKLFYPEFRTKLISIQAIYDEIKKNEVYKIICPEGRMDISYYLFYDLDDFIEVYNLDEKQDSANDFLLLIKKIEEELVNLNTFFKNNIVPVHNKKAKNLLLSLHEYCVFISWISESKYSKITDNIYNFDNISMLIKKLDNIFHKN